MITIGGRTYKGFRRYDPSLPMIAVVQVGNQLEVWSIDRDCGCDDLIEELKKLYKDEDQEIDSKINVYSIVGGHA
jgi:hypothetical protein